MHILVWLVFGLYVNGLLGRRKEILLPSISLHFAALLAIDLKIYPCCL